MVVVVVVVMRCFEVSLFIENIIPWMNLSMNRYFLSAAHTR